MGVELAKNAQYRFAASLAGLVIVCFGLLTIRIIASDSLRYTFLYWNLVLAVVPLGLAVLLGWLVQKQGWLGWKPIIVAVLWLLFLPNSFYIITDYIHLRPTYEADLLFDVALLTSFTITGLILGNISVAIVHQKLQNRWGERYAYGIVATIFLLASFAICLGRYTRWNTWDVLFRPAGLLFDISDRVINPSAHLQTYKTSLILFVLLLSIYAVCWEGSRYMRQLRQPKNR